MNRALKATLKAVVPAAVRRAVRARFGWRWMRGDYPTWAAAVAAADAAGRADHLERVIAAARAVRAAQGAWDRDGVVFGESSVHEPLLRALLAIAGEAGDELVLIDFGGGLGSTYWQHRDALRGLRRVDWRVVELPHLVRAGTEFADAALSFHSSLAAAAADGAPTVVLFSSVLQYLPDPYGVLADVAGRGLGHVVLDRIGFVAAAGDRLVVQHTPSRLGGGAMPCRLFGETALSAALELRYRAVTEWPVNFDRVDGVATYRGSWWRRREPRERREERQ